MERIDVNLFYEKIFEEKKIDLRKNKICFSK